MARVLLLSDQPLQGGLGRYARALYHALLDADRPDLGVDLLLQNVPGSPVAADWASLSPGAAGSRILIQPRPRWAKATGYGRTYQVTSLWYFPPRIPRGYAVYHVTGPLMGASVRHVAPCVVTVHDVIPLRLPGNTGFVRTLVRRRHLRAVPRARGLLFDSAHARREFLSFYDYPEERTAVVPLAPADAFVPGDRAAARAALGLPPERPIVLHVGAEEPRKNVGTLLDALHRLRSRYPQILLVRVGGMRSRTRRRIARLELEPHVHYASGLSDADLARHYQAADVFAFPSVYEGFGLPVLEALACGCPVVAGDATSVPEITGNAAILLDPRDADGFASAIGRVLDDGALAASLGAAGPARAASFTWRRVAAETIAMYRQVLGGA